MLCLRQVWLLVQCQGKKINIVKFQGINHFAMAEQDVDIYDTEYLV